jgi:hypothetical protein
MRRRSKQFGLLTLSLNPVNWAAFIIARLSGLTVLPKVAPISRTSRLTQAASVIIFKTGLRISRPSGLTIPSKVVPISRTPRLTQAAFIAIFETGLRISRLSPKLIAS